MEMLEAFGIHWKLLAAQAINFSIALFVLYRFAYKPIWAMLEKRQQVISKGLRDAEEAGKERASIASEKATIISEARQEGGKIVEELRKQGVETEHSIIRNAQEKSAGLLDDARKRAEEERAYLLRESEKDVARMAVLAAEKILRTNK
jgi:F-type H+-transporting ATPase subunit b